MQQNAFFYFFQVSYFGFCITHFKHSNLNIMQLIHFPMHRQTVRKSNIYVMSYSFGVMSAGQFICFANLDWRLYTQRLQITGYGFQIFFIKFPVVVWLAVHLPLPGCSDGVLTVMLEMFHMVVREDYVKFSCLVFTSIFFEVFCDILTSTNNKRIPAWCLSTS